MGDCVLRSKLPTGSAPNGATSLGALGRINPVRTRKSTWCVLVSCTIPLPLILLLAWLNPTHCSPRAKDKERSQKNATIRNIIRAREGCRRDACSLQEKTRPLLAHCYACCLNRKYLAARPQSTPSPKLALLPSTARRNGGQIIQIALAIYTAPFCGTLAGAAQARSAA